MTIASEITRIQTNIANAYTAASSKGATMPATENSDNLATCIASISGGGASGKYQLLERISDDNNNEIGTVSGFFTDANDVEYAVVCLDAQYRLASSQYLSNNSPVTNLPLYNDWITSNWRTSRETATSNCDLILAYATAQGYTSSAVSHCRSQSFVIDGTTYYGQLPNIIELNDIALHGVEINTADTSASSHTSLNFSTGRNCWSSTQYTSANACFLNGGGSIFSSGKSNSNFAVPVLEIPNN
jgi:hypothetical protein